MALIELSMITGAIVSMAADKGFKALGQSEAAVRVRKRLKLDDRPDPNRFGELYRHALVEWGVFKPEPVLDFFRDKRIVDAFERAYRAGDPAILQTEAAEYVRWADEFGAFRRLEYDPRREIAEFAATFDAIVSYSRTAAEVRQDEALARLERDMAAIRAAVENPPAGQTVASEVVFSGQFQNVIINLLSQLDKVAQSVSAIPPYAPPPATQPIVAADALRQLLAEGGTFNKAQTDTLNRALAKLKSAAGKGHPPDAVAARAVADLIAAAGLSPADQRRAERLLHELG